MLPISRSLAASLRLRYAAYAIITRYAAYHARAAITMRAVSLLITILLLFR